MATVNTVKLDSGCWISDIERLDSWLRDHNNVTKEYLLLYDDPFSDSGSGKVPPELVEYFQIPQYLLADIYRRSNGFFAFKKSRNKDGQRESFYMWFRTLIKIANYNGGMQYHWYEMTFCCRWDSNSSSVLCLGADDEFQAHLQQTLQQMWPEVQGPHPGSLLVPLVETIVATYDRSIWSIRDVVRQAEKDRKRSTHDTTHFTLLHEAARHAIHSSETLSVAIETLSSIQQQLASQFNQQTPTSQDSQDSTDPINQHLEFQVRMLRSLHHRAQSNKERLQNEMALAYNMIAQRDSQIMTNLGKAAREDNQVMKELGAAAKEDSGAMRTIAVVSMFFLPPTFISAVFSMSFFNYTPPQDGAPGRWSVSDRFWVYWVFAIPLTALTLGIWLLRQRWTRSS